MPLSLPKKVISQISTPERERESAQGKVSVPRAMKTEPSLQAMGANNPCLPPLLRARHTGQPETPEAPGPIRLGADVKSGAGFLSALIFMMEQGNIPAQDKAWGHRGSVKGSLRMEPLMP